jgi:hypothetical protein
MTQELLGGYRYIFYDLSEEEGRNVAAAMKWNRSTSPIRMAVLLM